MLRFTGQSRQSHWFNEKNIAYIATFYLLLGFNISKLTKKEISNLENAKCFSIFQLNYYSVYVRARVCVYVRVRVCVYVRMGGG